jgi:hypothetical protein
MSESQPSPLANSSEARTEDGTLKDQSTTLPASTSPETSSPTSSTQSTPPTTPEPKPPVEITYTDFKAPEGVQNDKAIIESAVPIFKELGLNQDQAQKLVDFYNTKAADTIARAADTIRAQGAQWEAAAKADPEIGPNLAKIQVDIGRAFDTLDSKTVAEFKSAMDASMVGNNPAFIKVLWKFAQAVAPGTHVAGKGPAAEGQSQTGTATRPSLAAAMYPNLPA